MDFTDNSPTVVRPKPEIADQSSNNEVIHVQPKEACKDFLRGVCNRGDRCRFYHPPGEGAPGIGGDRNASGGGGGGDAREFQFCHDYQNRGCFRNSCRYIHCPREEQDAYKRHGQVSEILARAILVSGQGTPDDIAGTPVCKDFISGKCDRGRARCRYWHIDPNDPNSMPGPEDIRMGGGGADSIPRGGGRGSMHRGMGMGGSMNGPAISMRGSGGVMMGHANNMGRNGPGAMMADGQMYMAGGGGTYDGMMGSPMGSGSYKRSRLDDDYMMSSGGGVMASASMHEDNLVLRQKLDVLKKQVTDLTAANEVLLEQNARLRAKLQVSAAAAAAQQLQVPNEAQIAASIAAAAASISNHLTSTSGAMPTVPTQAGSTAIISHSPYGNYAGDPPPLGGNYAGFSSSAR